MKSLKEWLCSDEDARLLELTEGLSDNALLSLPWLFDLWALDHQRPPSGNWLTWLLVGGRGAGKTRAGSEWIRSILEGTGPLDEGTHQRAALIGETYDQARDVMIFGDCGIMACSPPDRKPTWQATRRRLIWPNGATAQVFSASDSEALRGPQFDCAWLDELAKWKKARNCWDMLQFGLRLGEAPRQMVTTTPTSNKLLNEILEADNTVITTASTDANSMHLAKSYLDNIHAKYGNTRLGRQEIMGEIFTDLEGALWHRDKIDECRIEDAPEMDRIIVAVDPPVTEGKKADECGIIVAGVKTQGPPQNWRAFILADRSKTGVSPQKWASAAVKAYHEFDADRMVAEVNQGGDLVENIIRQIDPVISYKGVHATKGKRVRAEPVAALYEQGRVAHVGAFNLLEDQLCDMTVAGYQGSNSPDRLDALVWALTEAMILPASSYRRPRIRLL